MNANATVTVTNSEAFRARLRVIVEVMAKDERLATRVAAEVDAFFARYPDLQRTKGAEMIATVATWERIGAATGGSAV